MMEMMIGVDPHKGSHTAAMLDCPERTELGQEFCADSLAGQ